MSLTGNSHPIVTRGSRVSRAPLHHTLRGGLPAFQNLHGTKIKFYLIKTQFFMVDSGRNGQDVTVV